MFLRFQRVNRMDNKKLKMIHYLLDGERFVTGQELADYLTVSVKTIHRYVKDMNDFLREYGLEIKSAKGLGYILALSNKDREKLKKLLREMLQGRNDSRASEIMGLLLKKQRVKLSQLTDFLHLSDSALRPALEAVRINLGKYNLELRLNPNGCFVIDGQAANQIKAYLDFLIGRTPAAKTKYFLAISLEDINFLEALARQQLYQKGVSVSDFEFELLTNTLCIIADAMKQSRKWEVAYQVHQPNPALEEILVLTGKRVGAFSADAYRQVLYNIYETMIFPVNHRKFAFLKSDIIELLDKFGEKDLSGFNQEEGLIDNLVFHIQKFIERSYEGIQIENPIIEDIKKKYPGEFSLAFYLCKEIEKKYPCCLSENEIGFIAIYLVTYEEKSKREKHRVLILCHYGLGTANLIKEKVYNHFDNVEIVGVYPLSLKDVAFQQRPDIILSSVYLPNCDFPWIYIKNIFEDEFILQMKKALFLADHSGFNIERLMAAEDFFELKSQSAKEAIAELGQKMMEKQRISSEIINEVLEREAISSTEIGNSVAIPHALSAHQPRSVIGIGRLARPVFWGTEKVQLVILIAFNSNDQDNLPVFKFLYRFISNEEKVNNLLANFNYANFKKLLLK